jgi:ribosomal protein L20A (L18A)
MNVESNYKERREAIEATLDDIASKAKYKISTFDVNDVENGKELFDWTRDRYVKALISLELEFKVKRSLVKYELPFTLKMLEPTLNFLGYGWSNHYVPSDNPEARWSHVSLHGKGASRVGMTENQAIEYTVKVIHSKLSTLSEEIINQHKYLKKEQNRLNERYGFLNLEKK